MNTHVGAMPMAHLDRVTRAKPVTPVTIRQLLRVPLSSKLAGANLTIVLVAWVVGYVAHRTGATDWRGRRQPRTHRGGTAAYSRPGGNCDARVGG